MPPGKFAWMVVALEEVITNWVLSRLTFRMPAKPCPVMVIVCAGKCATALVIEIGPCPAAAQVRDKLIKASARRCGRKGDRRIECLMVDLWFLAVSLFRMELLTA